MKELPQNVSESTRKRNPHLYVEIPKNIALADPWISQVDPNKFPKPKPRIRQSTKPLLNRLEQRLFDRLSREHPYLHAQAITFKLANGVRYTPDIFCFDWKWKMEECAVAWEVKGPWATDDSIVKLKVFAAAYPMIVVLLASEDKPTGEWHFQEVWP